MNCKTCGFPKRKVWPPSSQAPKFTDIAGENWMSLEKCTECNTLWTGVAYEPYASFTYYVPWIKTEQEWKDNIVLEEGNSLHAWHKAQLVFFKDTLTQDDVRAIEQHQERSHGRDPYTKA